MYAVFSHHIIYASITIRTAPCHYPNSNSPYVAAIPADLIFVCRRYGVCSTRIFVNLNEMLSPPDNNTSSRLCRFLLLNNNALSRLANLICDYLNNDVLKYTKWAFICGVFVLLTYENCMGLFHKRGGDFIS